MYCVVNFIKFHNLSFNFYAKGVTDFLLYLAFVEFILKKLGADSARTKVRLILNFSILLNFFQNYVEV